MLPLPLPSSTRIMAVALFALLLSTSVSASEPVQKGWVQKTETVTGGDANVTVRRFYSPDNEPGIHPEKGFFEERTVETRNNAGDTVVMTTFYDVAGNPVNNTAGVAIIEVRTIPDDEGFVREYKYYNVEGEQVPYADKIHFREERLDREGRRLSVRLYDADRDPDEMPIGDYAFSLAVFDGAHVELFDQYDEPSGRVTVEEFEAGFELLFIPDPEEEEMFDELEEKVETTVEGNKTITTTRYYTKDGQPAMKEEGFSEMRHEVVSENNGDFSSSTSYYDTEGKPAESETFGFKWSVEKKQGIVTISYYDKEGNLRINELMGDAKTEMIHDPVSDDIIEIRHYGVDGKLKMCKWKVAVEKREIKAEGDRIIETWRFYDEHGNRTAFMGVIPCSREIRNADGKTVERHFLDFDDQSLVDREYEGMVFSSVYRRENTLEYKNARGDKVGESEDMDYNYLNPEDITIPSGVNDADPSRSRVTIWGISLAGTVVLLGLVLAYRRMRRSKRSNP